MTALEENQLNRREIEEARELLRSFQKDGFYTVPKVTWWLLNYEEIYKYSYENRHTGSCIEGMGCGCSWDAPESRFNDLHSALKEIVVLHEYEDYFRKELEILENVREDHPALMQWLKKNEKLGTEDFFLFWTEWLEEEDNIVKPWIHKEQNLGIKFRAEEWKNIIKFLQEFNEIYWDSEVCPSLEELKKKTT